MKKDGPVDVFPRWVSTCFDTVADEKDICHITACCFHQEFSLEQVEEENQWVLANPGSVGKWPLKWRRWHCTQLLTCEMSLQYLNCFKARLT